MTTFEDKLLGEKAHCYCSSSESEGEKSDDEDGVKEVMKEAESVPPPDPYKWEGSSTNTGPKGVMKDWQRFKQLEIEKRAEQEKERQALIEKLSLTCKSPMEEDAKKNADVDPEMAELLSDEFLLQYQKQRMEEMMAKLATLPTFGKVLNLKDGQEFLDAIDKEDKAVTIVVHIYEENIPGCEAMNGSLISLSQDYQQVKFCKMIGSVAGISKRFKISGVPALLVYKAGQLVGNFVRVSEELGDDFFSEDVESFLLEHGMLPDKTCVPSIIKSQNDADDSDLSLE
ncbi:Phosducin-like protein [Cryptotermes secundus]|uniref:Phosducin-like protein n=1 Tax=Cryptotermes secundus TaxID=105785 RepID=A0A2J7QH27_9NEOP|nr:phosducin-like protein [Cryptotermes secundus]PNF27863.1 Phosducin-like protein [Cryptotermes secundus]